MAIASTVTFAFHDDGRTLLARYAPDEAPDAVSRQWLRHFMASEGYSDLYVLDDGLDALAAACQGGQEPIEVPVAERRDGELVLTLSSNGMEAYATIVPAFGGESVDKHRLFGDLYDASISVGLQKEAITDLLLLGRGSDVVIAIGTPAEPGKNAWFEQLVGKNDTRGKPRILDDGSVDFYDLGTVVSVDVGDHLLRKHPATDGVPGATVTGEPIAAVPGRDAIFGPMGDSVAVAEDDPDLIVAARGGLPRYGRSWVKVEPILKLKDLDLSTGNIHFDGNVIVSGSVQAGLSLWAAGDIVIEGLVESAQIEAGGNVELRGGLVGQGEALIKAGGNVLARFVEAATIEAGQNVHIIDILLNSDVMALDSVFVQGGRKAQIVGGKTHATRQIRAAAAGAPAGVVTELSVGLNPYIKRQHGDLSRELETKRRKIAKLADVLVRRRLKPDPAKDWETKHMENVRETLVQETYLLDERVTELAEKLQLAVSSRINILDRIFGGVKILISDQVRWIKEDVQGCAFRLKAGEIVLSTPR